MEDLSIGDLAKLFGVCIDTLRGWDRNEKLKSLRTDGGHRRYKAKDIFNFLKDNYFLTWTIRCIDSQTLEMFNRYLSLDFKQLNMEDALKILKLVEQEDKNILHYRNKFVDINPEEIPLNFMLYRGVNLKFEYFEDEKENMLDKYEVLQMRTGNPDVILVGDLQSVYRLGPSVMNNTNEWTSKCADKMSIFLHLMENIFESKWLENKVLLNVNLDKFESYPRKQEIISLLCWMRQLVASNDEIFNKAINFYIKHLPAGSKRMWIEHEKERFNKNCKCETFLFGIKDYSNLDIIKLFIYGALCIPHSESTNTKHSNEAYKNLLQVYGENHLKMAFDLACRTLLSHMINIYWLLKRDYQCWIASLGIPPSNRVNYEDH